MHTHERTCMGTDADVHARTRTYEDGHRRIMGFEVTDALYVDKHTQSLGRHTAYGRENTRYAVGQTVINYNINYSYGRLFHSSTSAMAYAH